MSDKWHKDHKKAIAEKWAQCPQVSARKQELLSKWAIGQVGINALCEAHAHAEKELAEARAEIERLNKSFGDSLDTIFAMLLAARGAECDIDTLKAEMKPVSSKPSEYIKHTIAERDKLIEQMLEALEKIAEIGRQKGDARPQDAASCFLIADEAIKAAKGEYEQ